jgi:hypothetical protein
MHTVSICTFEAPAPTPHLCCTAAVPVLCRYRTSVEAVPVGEYTLPLGKAVVLRGGSDITLVGWGAQVRGQTGIHPHYLAQ